MAAAIAGCAAEPGAYRPPPERPDSQQLYEDFGDFRITSYYPPAAAQGGQEGWVLVGFSVGVDGCVSEVRVLDTSPPGYFEEAATSGFINRCFEHPKMVDGEPVESPNRTMLMTYLLED